MLRQLLLILGTVCFILLVGVVLINLKPDDQVTVHFVPGVEPQEVVGTVKRQERYLFVRPSGSDVEQVYAWDKVRDISGRSSFSSARFDDVSDVAEFLTKLGALAAAGVFFIGLYQYEQGQGWKRAEFLATMVKDISALPKSENAKLMLDGIKLYPAGREIKLFPDKEAAPDQVVDVSRLKTLHALRTTAPLPSDAETVAIRDCFDSYFTQLERVEQHIESGLITKEQAYTYMNYFIDLLSGEDADFADHDRWYVLEYAKVYKFPKAATLLKRYGKFREPAQPPPGYLPALPATTTAPPPPPPPTP